MVVGLLAVSAALAITSLVGDSITFDEPSHLASGMSYLRWHDYRLAPDHPPLGKLWAAWPLCFVSQQWPDPDTPSWREGREYAFGKTWLCELNDGQHLIVIARIPMVVLLVVTCLGTYALARILFGRSAGLLALTLAALSPTLLAHGRLVTTDLPLTLCTLLTLLASARLAEGITWSRLVAAAAALAALSLSKFSWPLALVGPGVMGVFVVARNNPWPVRLGGGAERRLAGRGVRLLALLLLAVGFGLTTWAAIWTAYGRRYGMFAESPAELAPPPELVSKRDAAWERVLTPAEDAGPLMKATLGVSAWARRSRLLPEAYLFGFARALETTRERESYLMGRFSQVGHRFYFPVAFAIKTPLAVLALLAAGLTAVSRRPELRRNNLLLTGMLAYVIVYALAALVSHIHIGHRHLLPLYPPLFALAGASAAAWWRTSAGKGLIVAALLWLAGANLRIHPHYLSYFNELVGGPRHGHEYLADSNIDWGQDLLRLAAYLERHPGEPVQLAYFGSVDPACYGIRCAALPSFWPFGVPAELTPGLYIVSVTQLLGVYDYAVRDDFWRLPEARRNYAWLCEQVAHPPPELRPEERRRLRNAYEEARRKRLINRLRHRPPDDRVGYSLFVYRLTARDLAALTEP